MNLYKVTRPYCTPSECYTFATSKAEAIKKIRLQHGWVDDSKAYLVTEKKKQQLIIDIP